jgi:hypothetical protein
MAMRPAGNGHIMINDETPPYTVRWEWDENDKVYVPVQTYPDNPPVDAGENRMENVIL